MAIGRFYSALVRSGRTRASFGVRYQSTDSASSTTRQRLQRVMLRLPLRFQGSLRPLLDAPVAHVAAFVILHELTAIVPVIGLTAIFHWTSWLPSWSQPTHIRTDPDTTTDIISSDEHPIAARIQAATVKFSRYFERKGWFGFGDGSKLANTRILMEIAVAYTITKLLLPGRIGLSLWATPWFARWAVVPVGRMLGRWR